MAKMQRWSEMNPRLWQEFVNQEVCVSAGEQHSFTGRLFTVDPVSASVVLVSLEDGERPAAATVVMGHAVTDVQILSKGTAETMRRMTDIFVPPQPQTFSAEQLRTRRESLRVWLQNNRVPVDEDGDLLRVAGALTISAPYRPQDCSCDNQIILDRVQSLLESNPALMMMIQD